MGSVAFNTAELEEELEVGEVRRQVVVAYMDAVGDGVAPYIPEPSCGLAVLFEFNLVETSRRLRRRQVSQE